MSGGLTTTRDAPARSQAASRPFARRLTRVHPILEGVAQVWVLDAGGTVLLGREPGPEGARLDDALVSRRHAELTVRDGVTRLRDLGSRNGTFVDGVRVSRARLLPGAVLQLGDTLFTWSEVELPTGLPWPESEAGVAPARSLVEARLDRVAASNLPVLIQGPTGAGKELLAARVHASSGRAGPLVTVNCATLNREMSASELFGHARGAFTGAQGARAGLFVAAHRGTFFLDEIAELPLDVQPALLRVVQSGSVRPVGADAEVAVDVRLVAASHRELATAVAEGAFRADLFERLAGLTVALPGLSERREEILPLFHRFLGEPARTLTIAAADALLRHAWPGNVRELQHVAQGIAAQFDAGAPIDLGHLPAAIQARAPREISAPESASDDPSPTPGRRPERDRLLGLLTEHEGNLARVARALGEHRPQLYRWLRHYDLDPASFRGVPGIDQASGPAAGPEPGPTE